MCKCKPYYTEFVRRMYGTRTLYAYSLSVCANTYTRSVGAKNNYTSAHNIQINGKGTQEKWKIQTRKLRELYLS